MLVLDTNVISELVRATPSPSVLTWLDDQLPEEVWTTSVTVFELRCGIELLPKGKRRQQLDQLVSVILDQTFQGRVLTVDAAAAADAAKLTQRRRDHGLGSEIRDMLIAGVTHSRHGRLVTRNTKDFTGLGLTLIDPWDR